MSDLISRQAAIEAVNIDNLHRGIVDALQNIILELPSADVVPVVRCKDCKWWDQIDNGSYGYCHACKHAYYSSNWEISIYRSYKEDWFCADGEREDDAEQV